MRHPRLDFLHPAPPRPRTAWLVLAAGLVATTVSAGQVIHLWSANRDLQGALDRGAESAGRRSGAMTALRPRDDAPALALEVREAHAVIAALDVPWDALFADLEAAARPGIVLTALQPDGEGRSLRIGGEAATFGDLTAYMTGLGQRPALARVLLASHERVAGVTRFTLTAHWKGRP